MGGLGGATGTDVFAKVEVYNPSTNTWATKAFMPTARYGFGAAAAKGL
jgi:hypothetical protein